VLQQSWPVSTHIADGVEHVPSETDRAIRRACSRRLADPSEVFSTPIAAPAATPRRRPMLEPPASLSRLLMDIISSCNCPWVEIGGCGPTASRGGDPPSPRAAESLAAVGIRGRQHMRRMAHRGSTQETS
jgi:hypothetical protein